MWAWVIGPLGPGHAWSPARFCSFLLVSSSVALSPSFAGEGDGFPRLVLPGGARRRKVRAAVPRFCSQSPTASSWSGSAGAAPPPQRRSCQACGGAGRRVFSPAVAQRGGGLPPCVALVVQR